MNYDTVKYIIHITNNKFGILVHLAQELEC